MRNALQYTGTVIAIQTHEIPLREVQAIRMTGLPGQAICECSNIELAVRHQHRGDRASQHLDIVAAVPAKDGIRVAESLISHQRFDGVIFRGRFRQNVQQADAGHFILAPDET